MLIQHHEIYTRCHVAISEEMRIKYSFNG